MAPTSPTDGEKKIDDRLADVERVSQDVILSAEKTDILQLEHTDPVLNAKMHLVNNAIDEIGFTGYQIKLFILNGFGYAVDSLILLIQSIIAGQAALEFNPSFSRGLTIAAYVGMLVGALFWGLTADIIGRKFAFNFSLMICSIFAIVAGSSPNWIVLGVFVALSAFGGGGNLVLDTAVFLEFLPSKDQWLLTLMAAWWGIGQLIAGLFAWAFIPRFSCSDPTVVPDAAPCTYSNNKGWRYVWFASGALVFIMSIARITIIRLKETPKFLVGEGRDEECVETLQFIAKKYNRPCSLTIEDMRACGSIYSSRRDSGAHAKSRFSFGEVGVHLKGLYSTRRIGISTSLIWFSWTLIGLAYPLYNVFLPSYLESRGAEFGETSAYITWRNYTLVNTCGIFGPVLAGYMCATRLGRKYTMVVGALVTMAFFFAYTQVRSQAQNLAFTCVVNFCLNIYYGTLYAYTPEVLPSAHRGTGNGIAIGWNRVMGIMSAVVATFADTKTPVPIYICAALYVVMAAVAAVFPFEPYGRRSS
ncbi:major facilitator superfamily domain-containing protein [Clohesyomyces aquaticus]|uniref:Major facilitator superfamily domain-containing protein n=1 Tax=Clohesyomyces aquaticus TaxID=1231657 RepID=A0A1Y2ACM7_9PLEO|nr:major facilitator superfamily domain-containing protein [Clohesyomyces aquaticus]